MHDDRAFEDRTAAGQALAIPLRKSLDLFLVRKLGTPGHRELAMGAIASGGVRVLNDDDVRWHGVTPSDIDAVTVEEQRELERREAAYRDGRSALRNFDQTTDEEVRALLKGTGKKGRV